MGVLEWEAEYCVSLQIPYIRKCFGIEPDCLRRIELQGTFTLPTSPMAILHGFSIQGSFYIPSSAKI